MSNVPVLSQSGNLEGHTTGPPCPLQQQHPLCFVDRHPRSLDPGSSPCLLSPELGSGKRWGSVVRSAISVVRFRINYDTAAPGPYRQLWNRMTWAFTCCLVHLIRSEWHRQRSARFPAVNDPRGIRAGQTRQVDGEEMTGRRRGRSGATAETIEFGMVSPEPRADSFLRQRSGAVSRDLAAWLARELTPVTLRELSAAFGLTRPDSVRILIRRLAAPTPPSPSGSVRRRLRDDAGPACARWLRSRLIPGLRPRGSPGRCPGTPARP